MLIVWIPACAGMTSFYETFTINSPRKKEELCQEEMEPARQEKAVVAAPDREEEEWVVVPAWVPVEIVFALNAAIRAPIPGERPAVP